MEKKSSSFGQTSLMCSTIYTNAMREEILSSFTYKSQTLWGMHSSGSLVESMSIAIWNQSDHSKPGYQTRLGQALKTIQTSESSTPLLGLHTPMTPSGKNY